MTFTEQTLLEIQSRKIDELTALSELQSKHIKEILSLLQRLTKLYGPYQEVGDEMFPDEEYNDAQM